MARALSASRANEVAMELNPFSYDFHEDPYPTYRWLRDCAPVYRNETLDFYALSRFRDVVEASFDHVTYSSAQGTVLEMSPEMSRASPMIIFMDPPRQTRLRKLVSKAFTPRRVAELEPTIRSLARTYLDAFTGRGECDFVADFAALLPIEMISRTLGVPSPDRTRIRDWSDAALARDPDSATIPPAAIEAGAKLTEYFAELVAERRRRPRDDMASLLLTAEVENEAGVKERLSDAEVTAFCGLLSGAGNETVTKLLGNAAVLLARHPDSRRRLVADPRRIPGAVEEILRYWAPSQYQGRTLTRDVELHGVAIPERARVLLLTGSACRDEREFPDPDAFDIERPIPIQIGFGHGVHKCLGAVLARLESQLSLEELLARIPEWEIDEAGVERVHMSNVHGFASVPMRWALHRAESSPA